MRPEQREKKTNLAVPPERPANDRAGLKQASCGCEACGCIGRTDCMKGGWATK